MTTALETTIQTALAGLVSIEPDYSASAADIARAIRADFDVHPRTEDTSPAKAVGICGEASPGLVVDGEPGPASICELPAGHAGWHRGANLIGDWGPSYGMCGVLGGAHALPADTTAAVDTDLQLASLAASLAATPHSVTDALRALVRYVTAGGSITDLPTIGTEQSRWGAGVLGAMYRMQSSTHPLHSTAGDTE